MTRIHELVTTLDLRPHPEGGCFAETFRSSMPVAAHGGFRAASTGILFLLAAGEVSRWHRVRSDELWHWYEGGSLELLICERPGTMFADFTLLDRDGPDAAWFRCHADPRLVDG